MQLHIEPLKTGFRVETGEPWHIVVEAATVEVATNAVNRLVVARLPDADNPLRKLAGMSTETDEDFAAFQEAIDQYRRERDTITARSLSGTKQDEAAEPLPDAENPWLQIAGIFKNDPTFDAWQEEIRLYRAERDADFSANGV